MKSTNVPSATNKYSKAGVAGRTVSKGSASAGRGRSTAADGTDPDREDPRRSGVDAHESDEGEPIEESKIPTKSPGTGRKETVVKQTEDDSFDPDAFNTMEEKRYRREKILRTIGFYPQTEDDKDTAIFVLIEHLLRIGAPFPSFRHNGSIFQPQPPSPANRGYPQISHPSRNPHVVHQGYGYPTQSPTHNPHAKPEEVRFVYIDPWTMSSIPGRSQPTSPPPPIPANPHHRPESEYPRDAYTDPSAVGYYHLGVQPRESYAREREYARPPSRDGHRPSLDASDAPSLIRESRDGRDYGPRGDWPPQTHRYDS